MSKRDHVVTDLDRDQEEGLEQLSEQEVREVWGAGLISSPMGARGTAKGVWVREIVEDVEAY